MLNFLLNNGPANFFTLSSAQLRTICELSKKQAEKLNNFILLSFFKYVNKQYSLNKSTFFFKR